MLTYVRSTVGELLINKTEDPQNANFFCYDADTENPVYYKGSWEVWLACIRSKTINYTIDDVPELFNTEFRRLADIKLVLAGYANYEVYKDYEYSVIREVWSYGKCKKKRRFGVNSYGQMLSQAIQDILEWNVLDVVVYGLTKHSVFSSIQDSDYVFILSHDKIIIVSGASAYLPVQKVLSSDYFVLEAALINELRTFNPEVRRLTTKDGKITIDAT